MDVDLHKKMTFSTKKVAKHKSNSLKFALITFFYLFIFAFQFLGGGGRPLAPPPGHAPAQQYIND